MNEREFSPWLLAVARRFSLFLLVGIVVVVSALFMGAWESAIIRALHEAEVSGATDTAAYLQNRQLEEILRIVTPTWNFVGLALLTFGIGMSIVVIIFNLNGAAAESRAAYRKAFPEDALPDIPSPWFARAFPALLFAGLVLEVANFLFALSGGLAGGRAIALELEGLRGSAEHAAALSWAYFVEVLRTPQRPGALSFIVLGIGLSLAAIVYKLRAQARVFPRIMKALATGTPADFSGVAPPRLPKLPFALLFAGLALVLTASYPIGLIGATARAGLAASVEPAVQVALTQRLMIATALFPVTAVTGIVTMLSGIVYFLLIIIQALRDQRQVFLRVGSTLAGAEIAPVEQPLWPERISGYLAGAGVLTLLMLYVPAFILVFVRLEVLSLQGTAGRAVADLVFLKGFLGVLIPDMRFIGMSLVMIAIGLILGVIVINLKSMGMMLPGTMAKVLRANGKTVNAPPPTIDEGDVALRAREAMGRFPKRLFAPLLLGALILISTTFPLVVPLHLALQLQHRDAQVAGDAGTAAEIAVDMAVLAALREPWNFIGMGLVFFAIGKFFGTIIGFVQARKVIVSDTCSSLASSLRGRGTSESGAR
jgi:hypothetical protein